MDSDTQHKLATIFGILGNIISIFVYFAPLPTFYRIYKKKSTEGFQSLPYVVALLSAALWLYYALLSDDAVLLLTINSFGCLVEFIYIFFFIAYATREARDLTVKLFLGLDVGSFSMIVLLTHYLVEGHIRIKVLGWICAVFSVTVFAAPLGIVLRVIRTKSVEFMPLTLSVCLTLSAVIWFMFGRLKKDYFVAAPNILGFFFGLLQILLYGIYWKSNEVPKEKLPERVINIVALGTSDVHPVDVQPNGRTHHEITEGGA